MAKLRRNHSTRGGAAAGTTLVKVTIFALILFGLIWAFHDWRKGAGAQVPGPSQYDAKNWYLPEGGSGPVIRHGGFSLLYDEEWKQAAWVAYILDGDSLDRQWVARQDNFRPDPLIDSRSATDDDYRGSGYDRGHLAPFADFAWREDWADETFLFSNISPQARQFNQGVWRELEELIRDWADREQRLYIVTGPVMTEAPKGYIGHDNRIAIPRSYYKVILDLEAPEQKGIGFIIPNAVSFRPLPDYVVTIDSVETVTDIDFFPELMPPDLEARIEEAANPDLWHFSKQRFDRRINLWNNVK
ncbi:endonuclease G [Neolewinella xylanilytica]|uniref:Endonuclease n=1 Tax=Neolewinella xylanilytica TaxID=1514080 RepID=A0A2S6IAP6_9BACT|nr:DNA/RNA non-specific endonuclease [Neolewinella xylanilytica]PPK88574.1 endonuclease G [Neolewinella xylanilytica]